MSTMKLLCLAPTLMLLSACSQRLTGSVMEQQIEQETGSSADVDVNADGSMHIATEERTYNVGNNQLPADWPEDAPIYAGSTIQLSGSANQTTGQPGAAAVLVTADSAADVMAFYKGELKKQGWTITSTMETQGATIMGATKGSRALSLMVGSANGQTSITIGVGEQ